jgi:pimeloyl-ACP methyl ester carboxylesterase
LSALLEIPLPITSKKALVVLLKDKGFDSGQAQWMTTNLKQVSSNPEKYIWKMDLPVIDVLFKKFLATDCWPTLRQPPQNAHIHFVRAEYNKFWTPDVLHKFAQLPSMDRVHIHLLEKSGHWVHVDNPQSLFQIMASSFK